MSQTPKQRSKTSDYRGIIDLSRTGHHGEFFMDNLLTYLITLFLLPFTWKFSTDTMDDGYSIID